MTARHPQLPPPPGHRGRPADDGWGARGRMKDASSTDVVVHGGEALLPALGIDAAPRAPLHVAQAD